MSDSIDDILNAECSWHKAVKSVEVYQGKPDKRDKLYSCVYECDGYKLECHTRQDLIKRKLI